MKQRPSDAGSSYNARHVNDLLSTLRGEQFRHTQNLNGKRRIPISSTIHTTSTLPETYADEVPPSLTPSSSRRPPVLPTGPAPPKSWTNTAEKEKLQRDIREWRTDVLSLVLSHLSAPRTTVPSLSAMCLRALLGAYEEDVLIEHVLPHLHGNLRREFIRYTAQNEPLGNTLLYALLKPDRNAVGELIVVGPQASLKSDYFRAPVALKRDSDWDDDEGTDSNLLSIPLETFVLLSARIPPLLTLPSTLTTLALIQLPSPISVHRLPGVCPLLVFIDLSYNDWLIPESPEIDRVIWAKWTKLRVLGMRGYEVSDGLRRKINAKGRWVDVDIVTGDWN